MVESVSKVILPKSSPEPECFKDVNSVRSSLCTICSDVPHPDKAIEEIKSGHIFCRECLEKWTKIKQICPYCNSSIDNNSQRPLKIGNEIACRILMELIANCPNKCSLSGTWNDLGKYLASCEKAILICKYGYLGCSFRGVLTEKKEHERLKAEYHLELAEAHIEEITKKLVQAVREENKKKVVEYVIDKKYTVSVHEHPLVYLTCDNGWACDGKEIVGGCKSGFTGFGQTSGALRFRCDDCDYDLCARCLEAYLVD